MKIMQAAAMTQTINYVLFLFFIIQLFGGVDAVLERRVSPPPHHDGHQTGGQMGKTITRCFFSMSLIIS